MNLSLSCPVVQMETDCSLVLVTVVSPGISNYRVFVYISYGRKGVLILMNQLPYMKDET